MRQSTSAPPYAVKTATLAAAGGVEVFSGEWEFFSVISATAPNNLEISINNQGFQPYVYGSTLFGLKAYAVNSIILRNTDGGANTVTVAEGGANYQQANSSALAPGAATAANQVLEIAQLTTINTNLGGNLKVQGVAADGAAVSGNPVLMGGQDGTNAQSLRVDTNGRPEMVGPVAAGAAISTHAPVMIGGSDGTNVQRVRLDTSGRPVVVGPVQHDSAVSTDAPVMNSGEARSTERAAVASADVCRMITDLVGKLVTLPYTIPETMVAGRTAAMTGTGDTAVIAAGGAGVRTYVTSIIITNSHATVGTEVIIKDNTTELLRVYVPALNGTAGPNSIAIDLPVPLRLSANTALNAANVTTGSNTYVAAVGYRGA